MSSPPRGTATTQDTPREPVTSETDATTATRQRDILKPGDVLGGAFQVRALIGEGGMGQVYEAHDRILKRRVAVKVPWPHLRGSVTNEARALAALRHPSLVTVHVLGQHAGLEYAVMERIDGASLADHIARRYAERGRFSVDEALHILSRIAAGLAVVHRAGIAHRDLKPDNIMLAPDNRVVIMDFGIFRPESEHTTEREAVGSPWYIAPEVISGAVRPGELFLADLYAFGVMAFELLTGEVPFPDKRPMAVLRDHLTAPIPDLGKHRPDAPVGLGKLVRELLAKEPGERPQSMEAVGWQLGRLHGPDAPLDRKLSVVIAEDNPSNAHVIRALIEHAAPHADIRVAADGRLALDLVRRDRPHLLIVDLRLPKMSGLEVCLYVRRTPVADQPAILPVSAHADRDDIELLRHLGLRFIPKGLELSELLPGLVRDLARRERQRRAGLGE